VPVTCITQQPVRRQTVTSVVNVWLEFLSAVTVKMSALLEVASCILVARWRTYFSEERATLKMEVARSSEMSIRVSQTTRRHSSEDSNFSCEYE